MSIAITKRTSAPMSPFAYFGVLALTYIALIFVLPASPATMQTYYLTAQEYHFLLLTITAPSILVWGIAFYGSAMLQRYATSIAETVEGPDFQRLARGIQWLAWSLPTLAILSVVLNSIANQHSNFHPTAIILVNYVSLILPFIGYGFLSKGSLGLMQRPKKKLNKYVSVIIGMLFVLFGILFCLFTFRNFDTISITNAYNPFFLPGWLLIITLLIPSLYAWFMGFLAAMDIALYSKRSQGLFYRRALLLLSSGIIAVIFSFIVLQYLSSVVPRNGHLTTNTHLVLIIIVRLISGVGYLLIASGASKLLRIEES